MKHTIPGKTIKKLTLLIPITLTAAFSTTIIMSWNAMIKFGPDRAIARIGGYNLLAKAATPTENNAIFYDSLKDADSSNNPKFNTNHTCNSNTRECTTKALAALNIRAQSDEEFISLFKDLENPRKFDAAKDNNCPAKYEITKLFIAAHLSTRTRRTQLTVIEKEFIEAVLEPIFADSSSHPFYSRACKQLLNEHPYLAHSYVYALAKLASNKLAFPKYNWQEILSLPNITAFTLP